MSRIGKQPISLPTGTTIAFESEEMVITGNKGTLKVPVLSGVEVNQVEDTLLVSAKDDTARAGQGLLRTLLFNAVTGVNEGWKRDLELHGVGMRASVGGTTLNLSLGFSHPVNFEAPEGISFVVTKNVISISGIDKQLVGEVAAQVRKLRKPEPYKGKGIRYSGEYVRRKAGKTGKTAK